MKRFWILIFCLLLAGVAGPAWAQSGKAFKIGGGIHFDENTPGANVAADFPLSGDIVISPFGDFFFRSNNKLYGGGVNLLLKRPTGGRGWVYIGGGGGIGYFENEQNDPTTPAGSAPINVSASKTTAMGNLVFGLEFAASERAMLFVQGKWMPLFGSETEVTLFDGTTVAVELEAKRSYAVQVGVSFRIGGGDRY